MSSDDPFSDDVNRTVTRPIPGGLRGGAATPQPGSRRSSSPQSTPRSQRQHTPTNQHYSEPNTVVFGLGLNPLVEAASPIINIATQLRNEVSHGDVSSLREHLIRQIRLFEDRAKTKNCAQNELLTARYLLCAFVDESVLSTPWGSDSPWASQSMLSTFHNETWGGEKFFQVLEKLLPEPERNINLLELMSSCLMLGFKGKYGVSDRGASQLMEIQDRLNQTIANQRGEFERELSPRWQGVPDKRHALVKYVPLWVVAALAGVLLVIVYSGFRFIIGSTASPAYEQIDSLKHEQVIEIRQ